MINLNPNEYCYKSTLHYDKHASKIANIAIIPAGFWFSALQLDGEFTALLLGYSTRLSARTG